MHGRAERFIPQVALTVQIVEVHPLRYVGEKWFGIGGKERVGPHHHHDGIAFRTVTAIQGRHLDAALGEKAVGVARLDLPPPVSRVRIPPRPNAREGDRGRRRAGRQGSHQLVHGLAEAERIIGAVQRIHHEVQTRLPVHRGQRRLFFRGEQAYTDRQIGRHGSVLRVAQLQGLSVDFQHGRSGVQHPEAGAASLSGAERKNAQAQTVGVGVAEQARIPAGTDDAIVDPRGGTALGQQSVLAFPGDVEVVVVHVDPRRKRKSNVVLPLYLGRRVRRHLQVDPAGVHFLGCIKGGGSPRGR